MRFLARHPAYALAVGGAGEHIAGGYFFYGIILFAELLQVAGEGGGVAADVDDPFGRHMHDRFYQLGRQSLTRGINDDHVGANTLPAERFGSRRSVSTEKARILDPVLLGVAFRVFDRLGDDLDADERSTVSRHGQADSARAAIEVEQRLAAGQRGVLPRFGVEALRLTAVDLVKRLGSKREAQPAERICHRILAVNHVGTRTENHVRVVGIDVEKDTFDTGIIFF